MVADLKLHSVPHETEINFSIMNTQRNISESAKKKIMHGRKGNLSFHIFFSLLKFDAM